MPTDIKVPPSGESIVEAEVGKWMVAEGAQVKKDQEIAELLTDKINVVVVAPEDGVLTKIIAAQGKVVKIGEVIGQLEAGATAKAAPAAVPAPAAKAAPAAAAPAAEAKVMPAAAKLMAESGLKPADILGSGPGGRILKSDVIGKLGGAGGPPASAAAAAPASSATPAAAPTQAGGPPAPLREKVERMTPLRRTIARNLKEAQNTAALLTTFNEVDMTEVMALRTRIQDAFVAKHGTKVGFMSFFVKAAVEALRRFPAVNSEIRGDDVVYKQFYDVGVAIGGGKGLVVPVLRNADQLSFAGVEKAIAAYAEKAKAGTIGLPDLQGGSFTITNGGVYGSLLSTPIVNPPQSGVLGMHGIVRRPVAVGTPGKDERVEIRPMMYIALTYDHRIVDGREAVTFLKTVKECIEDPSRLMLEC